MQRLIYRCAELHLNHIATSGDPFEFGSARPLDFGHWAAHKLEQLSEYQIPPRRSRRDRHCARRAFTRATWVFLERESAERILRSAGTLGFELFANELLHVIPAESLLVLDGLEEFREHLGGELTITLLKDIGKGFEVHEMNLHEVAS